MTKSYDEKILSGVNKTGFPLEMKVSAIFKKSNWVVLDHMYYLDKDMNVGREIDFFVANNYEKEDDKRRLRVNIGLAAEVKKSRSRAWVVLKNERSSAEGLDTFFHTTLARMHYQTIWFNSIYADHPLSLETKFGRTAFHIHPENDPAESQGEEPPSTGKKDSPSRSKNENAETVFAALISAFKASAEMNRYHQQIGSQNLRESGIDGEKKTYIVGISHGLIVFDGNLFSGEVDEYGEVTLERAAHIPYIFNYLSDKYEYKKLLIDIVHIDHLRSYIDRYDIWGNAKAAACFSEL